MIAPSLLFFALAVPPRAWPDTVVQLPEVRVERARAAAEAHRRAPTAFVTELSTGASGRALETLSELLGGAAGVHVQQYGGLGAFSTVSLRGAPPGQVAVYLDGAPLTSASHGVVSLGDLPATAVERIEVYRGIAPLDLAVASPGGAINLVTVSSPELREARLVRGAFGTWEARASAGGRRGALAGLVHAGYQGSAGDFLYPDDNGTPFNPGDDSVSTRVNNHFAATTALASLGWQVGPGLRVAAREDLFHKTQGIPGLGAVPAYATRLESTRSLSQLSAVSAGAGLLSEVRLRAGMQRERSRFSDRDAELGLGRHETDDRLGGEDLALEVAWARLPRGLSLSSAGLLRHESARLRDDLDGAPDPPPSRRITTGGTAEADLRPLGERLVLHAAGRWDRIDDRLRWVDAGGLPQEAGTRRTLVTPQLGVRLGPGRGVELRANWADARRAPDFLELFGNQGSVLGNPDLRPERARNWDAGGSWSHAWGDGVAIGLEGAHFESRAEDLVVYLRHSQSSVRAENVSRADIAGEEVSAHLSLRSGLTLSAAFTRLSTHDQGPVPFWNGRRLPQRPERQGNLRADWARGRIRVAASVDYLGENFLDRANLQRVPERLLAGGSLSYSPAGRALRFTVEGKNLGDDRASDVGGFPLPGRALFVSCDLNLVPSSRHP